MTKKWKEATTPEPAEQVEVAAVEDRAALVEAAEATARLEWQRVRGADE